MRGCVVDNKCLNCGLYCNGWLVYKFFYLVLCNNLFVLIVKFKIYIYKIVIMIMEFFINVDFGFVLNMLKKFLMMFLV